MAVTALRRLAAAAPAPVFVARGGGSGLVPADLDAEPRVEVVASPRQATVLLAAGRFPGEMGRALDRVHDQLPAPRRTVWWTADRHAPCPAALERAAVAEGADPVAAVVAAHREALTRAAPVHTVLADQPPHPFEGAGDYGQGGEGMMGGVPYGRPMAMTADDRDGLSLDQLPVVFGPFLRGLPNGLRVRTALQGGTVQDVQLEWLDLGDGPVLGPADGGGVRYHLRRLVDALRLGGLDALARRAARLARVPEPDPAACAALAGRVRRSGLPAAWSGVGRLDGEDARHRLERHLAFERRDGRDETVAPDRVAGVLAGQDWSDALVTIWSFDLRPEPAPAPAGADG